MNWLITGGCGFIGTSLISHLVEMRGEDRIRVLDNLLVGSREDLGEVCEFSEGGGGRVQLLVGDIQDYGTCEQACAGMDVVVHLAANTGVGPSVEQPRLDMEANVIGTFNMLEAARQNGVDKFVFASSGAPLGEVEPPITEEKPARPVSPYGASKLAGEGYCSAYYRTFGLKTVALRFGNVYGTRSKHKNSVVAKFFKEALRGERLEIYGDGSQTRDFIYIDDLIQAILLAVEPQPASQAPAPWGEVFQIATYKETSVRGLADKIRELVERETGVQVEVVYSAPRLGDVKRNFSDISKAKKMLGFAPRYDIDRGLKETCSFFRTLMLTQAPR